MARQPFFVSACSNCHSPTEVELPRLGRETTCHHCGQAFVAIDTSGQSAAIDDPLSYWIRFTDHVYSRADFESISGRDLNRTPR